MFNKNLIIITSFALSTSAYSATILMDYDDGDAGNGVHDAIVANGDIGVQDWTGTHQYQTNNNSGIGSDQNLILGSNRDAARSLDHTIALGDSYEASYMWRAAANWDAVDRMIFSLFYTDDNTITGTRINLFSEESAEHDSTFTVETVSTHVVTDAGAVGKNVFVEFTDNASAGNGEFTRLDNVFVSVEPGPVVPEPTSTTLLGLGGLALVLRRKK